MSRIRKKRNVGARSAQKGTARRTGKQRGSARDHKEPADIQGPANGEAESPGAAGVEAQSDTSGLEPPDGAADEISGDDAEVGADGGTEVGAAVEPEREDDNREIDRAARAEADGEVGVGSGRDDGAGVAQEAAADDEAGAGAHGEPLDSGRAEDRRLKSILESLLFAADKPLTPKRLGVLAHRRDSALIKSLLGELADEYCERGIVLHEVAGGWQFRTAPQNSHYVQALIGGRPVRLSRAQLETLAIVAYRQPITRPEIDDIRGVDSGGTLKVLLDRHLIRVLGKKEEPGRPLLYGTTREFLEFFNLSDLRDLPTLREYHELTEDSMRVVERMGVDLEELAESARSARSDAALDSDSAAELDAVSESESESESDAEAEPAADADAGAQSELDGGVHGSPRLGGET
ncbi:MAG: SMC-Scp complex subunit ScpB [Proteobacteria bacterium]|nr:SMC-Scp complex subunit ScpB [Pseudomonadota bacterium]